MPSGRALDAVPAPALFVASGITQYLGAAIAVGLFATVGAPEVAWLRILVAAVVLVLWRRPWRSRWTRRDLAWVAVFGVFLAAMNVAFYVGIAHLPLGTAVAIEFLGPVGVAAVTGRGWRERVAIVLAAGGVVLLAGVTLESDLPRADVLLGLAAVLTAAACWAGYVVLGRRVAVSGSGVTSLAVAMSAGALVFAPFLAPGSAVVLSDAALLAGVVGVALLSSVVPYVIDQVVLRRLSTATFAVLLALLPASATLVGAVVLGQVPTLGEVAGLVLVSGAIALTGRTR
ncbi:inner membrane transporter RhtA [Sediminihabitans luteus]|uniref:Inner membrane transporter RhtA n=1 Tax=Sediminihabitans luteus TaxID=1138585 RepID=A0A2M9CCA1_9CELL|nr:EamA family transporter [Sediminihabitans luteus]PJJ68640.1 inner membrane transporter RhtA [Sediminihabitans luteus]GII99980.1 permease [Sediminihabitans luteus]